MSARNPHRGGRRSRCCTTTLYRTIYLSGVVEDAARGRRHDLVEALALQLRVGGDGRVELRHVWI